MPLAIAAPCSVGLFVPAGTLRPPWGSCLSALPCGLNVWRLPTSALAGGHRLARCPAGGAPTPRPCWRRGAPLPLLRFPAPAGRAPSRWPGLRESGVPLRGANFSAGASGAVCGLGASLPRSVGWVRSSLWSCRPSSSSPAGRLRRRTTLPSFRPLSSPPPAAYSLRSSAPAFQPLSLSPCSMADVLGLPNKPLTLRRSRTRPPRRSIYLESFPATSTIEGCAHMQPSSRRGAPHPSPTHHPEMQKGVLIAAPP